MEDRQDRIRPYDPRWTTEGPNILAEDNLGRIRQTLEHGWVCGMHLYYGAGASGDAVAFSTYRAYLSHVESSRPGDLFILWSVPEIRNKRLVLVDRRYEHSPEAADSLLSSTDLRRLREYLLQQHGESREILAVASFGSPGSTAILTDYEGSGWEPLLNAARRACVPGGALCIMPFTTLTERQELLLLKAKRPNSLGEVPLGGAY